MKASMSKSVAQLSDTEFLAGLRDGDNEILRVLYKKYYHSVLKLVVNNSGSSDAAQDVYQEAIIVLYENVKKPGFELHCQLQTYIYSVAKRIWLKQLQKQGRTFLIRENEEDEIADVSEDVAHHQTREQNFEKITKSIENLGEPCATLIKDFYVRKLSMDEIAEKFGYTNADNAKNQKYKCMQRLKKNFFNTPEEEERE
jgi:RNA polymerase sigma factor (sigma-70 family)